MQQTTNYKLNLIDTSDTFSPAPLNENAQKTEAALDALHAADAALTGAVAAAAAENCLVKLGGVTVQFEGEEPVFDLSEIDLTQFAALLLLGGKPKGATTIQFNDDSDLKCPINSATAYPCAGFTLLTDSGEGRIVLASMFTISTGTSATNSYWGNVLNCSMSELRKIRLMNINTPGAHFTLYGVRA